MFGHLKAEDFIGLLEGEEAAMNHSVRQTHLRSCARCAEAFVSMQELHSEVAKSDLDAQEIPEPDWFQFRSDVRNTMLSRAAQRQSKENSWTGWLLKPAMTWGLAVAFAAGLSAGLLVWNRTTPDTAPSDTNKIIASGTDVREVASAENSEVGIPEDAAIDAAVLDPELAIWSQGNIFEKISQLDDDQSEKLIRLLEAENSGSTIHQ